MTPRVIQKLLPIPVLERLDTDQLLGRAVHTTCVVTMPRPLSSPRVRLALMLEMTQDANTIDLNFTREMGIISRSNAGGRRGCPCESLNVAVINKNRICQFLVNFALFIHSGTGTVPGLCALRPDKPVKEEVYAATNA